MPTRSSKPDGFGPIRPLDQDGYSLCDNLSVYKNAQARAAIEARDAELRFLPAYSPDLNPIEMVFAKIKVLVRSVAARCADTLDVAIFALTAIPQKECARYLRHAGYEPT